MKTVNEVISNIESGSTTITSEEAQTLIEHNAKFAEAFIIHEGNVQVEKGLLSKYKGIPITVE
ncbi:hypothetical protein [Brevibacillus sp. NRS-1366]|uniref:hypothetical protein n=1 Tax=Brevibacillus sp. NRS-1366 TaxID=3233899 RepID=UPI003D1BE7A0